MFADHIQSQFKDLLRLYPNCTISRKQLKALLLDYFPNNKREVSLLLIAYDEDIHNGLIQSNDYSIYYGNIIRRICNDYCITLDAAKWAVATWCYALGKDILQNNDTLEASIEKSSAEIGNNQSNIIQNEPIIDDTDDPLISSIKEAGFEYIDTRYDWSKRLNWLIVIANLHYKPFFDEWEKKGVPFKYSSGTPSSDNRPMWWTEKPTRKRIPKPSVSGREKERKISVGIYEFGKDIPIDVYIKADKHEKEVVFHYGIVDNPIHVKTDRTFTDQLYICGHSGQYLILRASDNANHSFTIKEG